MSTEPATSTRLPLRRSLASIYAASLLIAALMAATSLAGLLSPSYVYPSDELVQAFLANDVALLAIGLPILLGSMWLARRGRLLGLLLWPGALVFAVYNYLAYVLAMPFNAAYLLHLLLLALSTYTLVALAASIEGEPVRQQLQGAVAERLAGGVLAGLGLLFFLRAAVMLVSALAAQTPMAQTERALNSTDLLLAPVWVGSGLLLWQRRHLGYVAGLGVLFQASMLFIGLVLVLLLQPALTGAPFAPVDVLVVLVMGLICFVPLGLFVRGVTASRGAH
jgi:hypothetical protein